MGLTFSTNSNDSLKRSNVKLQAQQVPPFNGHAIKWRVWKKKTRAAIGTAGLLNTLDDPEYAKQNPIDNETIFHILQVATSDGSASHLVDQFEDSKDGHAAYTALVTWYEGDELTTETAEDIRSKLDKLILSTRVTASEYINLFQQYNKQLTELGEDYTKSKTVNIFLSQISDPDYDATKELCIENKLPLNECIERIRSKERRLTRNKDMRRRPEISSRRDRHEPEVDDKLPSSMDKYITANGYYSIPDHVWSSLTKNELSTVKRFNQKVRRNRGRHYQEMRNQDKLNMRRNHIDQERDNSFEPPIKRQKTVQFIDGEEEDQIPAIHKGETPETRTTRREALTFSTKNKPHTNNLRE